MKALVKTETGSGFVELQDVPIPVPKANEVRIKVASAGICGTDIKIRNGKNWCNPPVILGHEYSGTIVEVGADVQEYKVGDRVISETAQHICGKCEYCKTGSYIMCPERLSIGYGVDGAFAEYIVVREDILHRIPDDTSFDDAAMCEPTAVAVHAVFTNTAIMPYDTVMVMGPGPVGLMVAQAVKSTGAETLVAGTKKDAERLAAAKKLGMDAVYITDEENVVELVKKRTGGKGADVVFDCTGAPPAINTAIDLVKNKGFLVQIGLTPPSFELDYAKLPLRSIGILGTYGHGWQDWEIAMKMIAGGKFQCGPVITHHFPLDEWEKAFAMSEKGEGIKIMLHPND